MIYLFFIVIGVMVFYIFILFVYIKIFCEVVCQVKNFVRFLIYENQFQVIKEGKWVIGEVCVVRVFVIIVGIFVISWMFVFYMIVVEVLDRLEFIFLVFFIVLWYIMMVGLLVNVVVYVFFKGDFRNVFLCFFYCYMFNFC